MEEEGSIAIDFYHKKDFKNAEIWLKKGVEKNDKKCICLLGTFYLKGIIKGSNCLGAKYLVQSQSVTTIKIRLGLIESCYSDTIIDELFVYGRAMYLKQINIRDDTAIYVYKNSTHKTKKALLYFMWFTKFLLHKDIRLLIGNLIWESRYQAGTVWQIKP